jgi:glutathione peroxidase
MGRIGYKLTLVLAILLVGVAGFATNRPKTGPAPKFRPLTPSDTTPIAKEQGQAQQGGQNMQAVDYLNIPFKTINGNDSTLEAFKGEVVLIVNVASKCGYTPQYKDLEALYEKYKSKGFVVVGFPANNFGGQEPGTNAEIQKFCTSTYGVTFPMMSKISVKGDDIHPLFEYLTAQSPIPGDIKWNFSKFLLDRNGILVARYQSDVTPFDPKLTGKIESLF